MFFLEVLGKKGLSISQASFPGDKVSFKLQISSYPPLRCGFRLRWIGGGMASTSAPPVVFLRSGGVRGETGVKGELRKPMWAGGGTCLPRDAKSPVAGVG